MWYVMEKRILDIKLTDKIRCEIIRKKTGVRYFTRNS